MSSRSLASLSLALVVLLSATSVVYGYDKLRDYNEVPLDKLKQEPKTYKNTQVKFKVYFHKIDRVWSPFFSPFSAGEYMNFSGWSARKHLWKKDDMVNDFPFLYIRNDQEAVEELLSADTYDLIQIKGSVRSAFKSFPWIEVRHVDIIRRDAYTEKQLRYLMLAGQAHKNEQPTKATRYFEKGLKTNRLTRYDRAEVLKHLAINYYQAHDYRNALRVVEAYNGVTGERDDLLHRIRNRSREMLRMSPEERNARIKDEMKTRDGAPEQTGMNMKDRSEHERNGSTLEAKYRTLLSRHKQLLREHQSLKRNFSSVKREHRDLTDQMSETRDRVSKLEQQKQTLKNKLSRAYQKNAQLLAKIRKPDQSSTDPSLAGESDDSRREKERDAEESTHDSNRLDASRQREKLLSRIRILKRRNQSLRSRMTSLSNEQRKTKRELERLRNQVQLQTSAAPDTTADRADEHGS